MRCKTSVGTAQVSGPIGLNWTVVSELITWISTTSSFSVLAISCA